MTLNHVSSLYLAFLIGGGQVGLPIIIATFLFTKVHRHPTLINFCITWVIYSVSYSILLLSHEKNGTLGPVCFVQSVMIHGAPPMSVIATLVVVVQLWSTFLDPEVTTHFALDSWPRMKLLTALALPYVAFFVFAFWAALVQMRRPELLEVSHGLYCTVSGEENPFGRLAVQTFCIITLSFVIFFEVVIAFCYFTRRKRISAVFPLAHSQTNLKIALQVIAFSLWTVITFSAGVFFLTNHLNPWPLFAEASLPLAVFLVFGFQKDVLVAWGLFKRCKSRVNADETQARSSRHNTAAGSVYVARRETDSSQIEVSPV